MLKSVRTKMFVVVIAVIMAIVLMLFLMNSLLLPEYYMAKNEQKLKKCYIEVADMISDKNTVRDLGYDLQIIQSKNAVRITISDVNGDFVFGKDSISIFATGEMVSDTPGRIPDSEFSSNVVSDETHITVRYDTDSKLRFVNIYGRVFIDDEMYNVVVDTTVDAINDNVRIFNTFLLYSAAAMLLTGGIVMFFVSGRFVKPIVEVNDVAKKMVHLDFSTKIKVKSKDEVGQLAENINSLSSQLEVTIGELRHANRQLMLDLEDRKKTDTMRKEFISNVSHELKTPISLIMGYAEGLKVGINEEEKDLYCDVITDEAQNMSKMVSRLLYISKIDSDAMKPQMKNFELCPLIDSCLEKFKLQLQEGEITVEKDYRYTGELFADEDQILQVVTNFVSNAIHHSSGEKRIVISTELTPEGKKRVSVFNTGENIPENSIAHVWESFYKVDTARTRSCGGTGLGLYIVSRIIENHNGNYKAENTSDGVRFTFELD